MTSPTIVVVSAGLRIPSSTRLLADQLGAATSAALAAAGTDSQIVTIELREHAHAIADALLTGFASGALAEAVAEVTAADGLIVVTPTFGATYSGLFKSFIDVLDQDSLRGTPVLLAATGGTERHSLMLEHALRPLFSHLAAAPVATAVYAATADFGGPGAEALTQRVGRAARELATAVTGASRARPKPSGSEPFGAEPSGAEPSGVEPAGVEPAGVEPAEVDVADHGLVSFDRLLARVGAQGIAGPSSPGGADADTSGPATGGATTGGADSAYDRLRRAQRHVTDQRYLEAVEDLQLVLAEPDPGMPLTDARTLLARAYFGSAQLHRAEAMARRLLDDDPSDAYAAQLLARSLHRQSRHEEAAGVMALANALGG